MSTTELQQQLQARGVNYQGLNKYQLEDALWRFIQVEAGLLPAEDTAVSLLAHLGLLAMVSLLYGIILQRQE